MSQKAETARTDIEDCPTNLAYVRHWWFFGTQQGVIHVCPPFFGVNYQEQVVTIIHEMGHKYANLDDEAYEWEPKYPKLSTGDALDNADSYAAFARDI